VGLICGCCGGFFIMAADGGLPVVSLGIFDCTVWFLTAHFIL
jgi:hypothetical protein